MTVGRSGTASQTSWSVSSVTSRLRTTAASVRTILPSSIRYRHEWSNAGEGVGLSPRGMRQMPSATAA